MNINLTEKELSYIKIALSNWHCLVTCEAIHTGDKDLNEAAYNIYKLYKKIEALV